MVSFCVAAVCVCLRGREGKGGGLQLRECVKLHRYHCNKMTGVTSNLDSMHIYFICIQHHNCLEGKVSYFLFLNPFSLSAIKCYNKKKKKSQG